MLTHAAAAAMDTAAMDMEATDIRDTGPRIRLITVAATAPVYTRMVRVCPFTADTAEVTADTAGITEGIADVTTTDMAVGPAASRAT